jgi:hypothetical protein
MYLRFDLLAQSKGEPIRFESTELPIAFRELYAYIGGCASPLFVMPY